VLALADTALFTPILIPKFTFERSDSIWQELKLKAAIKN
jgi:hypothetical protein